ncbi:MAG: response regulator [Polyangiaceae bacterium]
MGSERAPADTRELDALEAELAALDSDRSRLVGELNRVIALADFDLACTAPDHPREVIVRARQLIQRVLGIELCDAVGLVEAGLDLDAFGQTHRSLPNPTRAESAILERLLRGLPGPRIFRLGVDSEGAHLLPLLTALFDLSVGWADAVVVVLPIRPRIHQETYGALIACSRTDSALYARAPGEADATFLVLLANHIDRAVQSAMVVADLRASQQAIRDNLEVLQRTRAQLVEARKLESIGRLADGIAHDFNNVLTIVKHHVEHLQGQLPHGSPLAEEVQAIAVAADRGARLARQLLAFKVDGEPRLERLDLNRVLEQLVKGMGRLTGEHVTVDLKLDTKIGLVRSDRAQLEQILLAVLGQACSSLSGGTLRLETRSPTPLDLAGSSIDKGAERFVVLSFKCEPRANDYLVSTTPPELSSPRAMLTQLGGHMLLFDDPGHHRELRLLLPAATRTSSTFEVVDPRAHSARRTTILLVEDDAALRRSSLRTLRSGGYNVVEAQDGEHALAVAETIDELDAIVTDVVMPNLSGPRFIQALAAKRGPLRVLYVSGYTLNMLDGRAMEGGSFLSKPFDPADLLAAVREVLSRPPGVVSAK